VRSPPSQLGRQDPLPGIGATTYSGGCVRPSSQAERRPLGCPRCSGELDLPLLRGRRCKMALCRSGAARWASEDEQRPDELAVPEAAQRPRLLSNRVSYIWILESAATLSHLCEFYCEMYENLIVNCCSGSFVLLEIVRYCMLLVINKSLFDCQISIAFCYITLGLFCGDARRPSASLNTNACFCSRRAGRRHRDVRR
jgi:hypothetical protein